MTGKVYHLAPQLDAVTSPGYYGRPMLDEGFWAEIKIGDDHLRLFSERSAQGVQASVFNVNTKTWIALSEALDDIEEGKERAEAYAKAYLKHASKRELPPIK